MIGCGQGHIALTEQPFFKSAIAMRADNGHHLAATSKMEGFTSDRRRPLGPNSLAEYALSNCYRLSACWKRSVTSVAFLA